MREVAGALHHTARRSLGHLGLTYDPCTNLPPPPHGSHHTLDGPQSVHHQLVEGPYIPLFFPVTPSNLSL